nr:MAG TPA: hypothetical protein [Caudoviricetes sp.]
MNILYPRECSPEILLIRSYPDPRIILVYILCPLFLDGVNPLILSYTYWEPRV